MKKLLTFSASAMLAFALLFGGAMILSNPAQAHAAEEGQTEQKAESDDQSKEENADEKDKEVYRFVAQPGDTYTQMARKAVQIYGIENEVNLSEAQIIAAETNLTVNAGSPSLTVGQVVEINRSDVKTQATAASELSESEQAAWEAYNVGVDFNTNSVGEEQ